MKTRLLALAGALWLTVSGPSAGARGTAISEDLVGTSVNPFPLPVSADNRLRQCGDGGVDALLPPS